MAAKTWFGLVVLVGVLGAGCGGSDRGTGTGGDPNVDPGDDAPDGGGVRPGVEVCNGSDDNGDRLVDEGCTCTPANTQSCFPGPTTQNALERCQLGVQTCQSEGEFGAWGACEGFIECEVAEQELTYGEAENVRTVDIVMTIDQSASMNAEIAAVKSNINMLSNMLLNSGIDFRLTMVAERGTTTYDICVPEPLAGPACADSARFKQIDVNVQSWDGLTILQENFPAIEAFMRPDSLRVFIVVTDDNPSDGYQDEVDGMEFHTFVSGREGFGDYVFHSVIGDDKAKCPSLANVGTDFIFLSTQTGGLVESICTMDWSKTFQNFATDIITKTLLYPLIENPYDVAELAYVDPKTGTKIPQARGTVWDYDPAQNSIVLFPGFTPPNGTKIVVTYRKAKP